jgi:Protein of unknown function (DUF3017)
MVRWEVPPTRRIAFVVVLAVVALSVIVTIGSYWRAGGYLLSGALALAAGLRAGLPEKYCLGLLVRSRQLDVLVAGSLAAVLFVLTWTVPS